MSQTAKPYWESALQSLQMMIADRPMSDGVLARSQERVLRYREHLEHAAVRSKYQSSSFRGPDHSDSIDNERGSKGYRAHILTPDGRIAVTKKLVVESDAEALHAVATMADSYAVDLWDGLRFIEHFEPKTVSTPQGLRPSI